MSNGNTIEIELAPELLQLGEVAGFLRAQNGQNDPATVVGARQDEQQTPLVLETDWFSDPIGEKGLGGLPNRLDTLLGLLETVGFLGAAENEDGESGSAEDEPTNPEAVRWYPILDPTSAEKNDDTDDAPKKTGIYLVHEAKGGEDGAAKSNLIGIGFRRVFASHGISLQPSAVLPLFYVNGSGPEFVTGSDEHPVKFGFRVVGEDSALESNGFSIGSFAVSAALSASPSIDFGFAGIGLPNMASPSFPGAANPGELDLGTIAQIPAMGEEWLTFFFDLLVAQMGETAQVSVANVKYLLGFPGPDDSASPPAWENIFNTGPNPALWLKQMSEDPAALSQWLHGWFCLLQGVDVNENPPPEEEIAAVALIDLPGIVKLDLTLGSGNGVLTPGLRIESPLFSPAKGIGIQLSAQTNIADFNLASGSVHVDGFFPALDVTLSLRNPEEGDDSPPLFSYQSAADASAPDGPSVSLGAVDFAFSFSAEGIAAQLTAKELSVGGANAQDYSLEELFGAVGGEEIIHLIAEAIKQAYADYLPDDDSDAAEFVEKYLNLRDYTRFLRVVVDFAGIEVGDDEDPFPAVVDCMAEGLQAWAQATGDPANLPSAAQHWFVERIAAGGLTKALGGVLSGYYAGISVEGNLLRFHPVDAVSVSLGVNADNLFGVWIEPELTVVGLTCQLAGGVGFPWDDLSEPEFSLVLRVSADASSVSIPGVAALPALSGELTDNGGSFALTLYPQGEDAGAGIELLPDLDGEWLEKLALQLLLPLASDIALNNDVVQEILKTPFPGTEDDAEINLRRVLTQSRLLLQDDADALHLNTFAELETLTPESFLQAVLDVLLSAERIEIVADRLAIVKRAADEVYGLQMNIPGLSLRKERKEKDASAKDAPPSVKLQVGPWLSGEDDSQNWYTEAGGAALAEQSGLSLYLVSKEGVFTPSFELISVGLDIEGTAGKPLFSAKGYQLQGLESRIFFSWTPGSAPQFGAAILLNEMGIPLGPNAGGDAGKSNPVAGNLLASGDGGAGGETQAVNPTFSAVVAYVDKFYGKIFSDIPSADGMAWLPVSRNFGPLHCRQIGLGFVSRVIENTQPEETEPWLAVGYDGGVALGPLNIDLDHLTIDIPLRTPQKFSCYELGLAGLDVSYAGGPISISGGFLKTVGADGQIEYSGMALIKAADFTITGFGSYAVIGDEPSLFIFAVLHKDLGGPSFFHVTGLAAGFGYNRALRLPPIEEVHTFPLVRGALEDNYFDGSSPDQSIVGAMRKLHDYIPPSRGDYWFAVGVRFTSFEMIHSFALLSVSFGHEVQIALLGMSKLSVPGDAKPGEAIVYAELAIKAVIRPEEGTLAIEGRLTDESYVYSKDCHLTGGFAFYSWFSGPHAGDFVITLGGYHPKFVKPDHYPVVPRLAINWQVSSELTVTAELYCALTPSCLMAGGKLSVVYQTGCIKAWFTAYADFLLSWKPFYYLVDMGIEIGVEASVRIPLGFCTISISISVRLSVQLSIWGPEFAGSIEVDLSVISFTVRFGPAKAPPPPIAAQDFVQSFLPPPQEMLGTQITGGLIRQENQEDGRLLRVVNAHALVLTSQSLIPVTEFAGLTPSGARDIAPSTGELGIRSMGKVSLASTLTVIINGVASDKSNLRVARVKTGVPDALWGKSTEAGVVPAPQPEANTFEAQSGIRISFAPIHPQGALPPMAIEKFAYETFDKPIPWNPALQPAQTLSSQEYKTIDTVMDTETIRNRQDVLAVLAVDSPFVLNPVALERQVAAGGSYFQDDPEVHRVGEPAERHLPK